MVETSKRPYDSRRRRARAEQERAATRQRVVAAATDLFLEQGYNATTMNQIAQRAGVALQSVYTAGKSKAELLHLVIDFAVAGDGQEVMLVERPGFVAIAEEPDARRQVEMFADLITATMSRLAPVWATYREAAAVDAKAAANLLLAHKRRRQTFGEMIRMVPEHRLRHSYEKSADTMWAIGSIDVFLLQRSVLGWDADQHREWLRATLVDQLLESEV